MCLKYIEHVKLHRKVGWKILIFNESVGTFSCPIQGNNRQIPFSFWVNENNYRCSMFNEDNSSILSEDNSFYDTGFHIYKRMKDAFYALYNCYSSLRCYRVCKVEFDDIAAAGTEHDGHEVIVARKMKIIKVLNRDKSVVYV